MPTAKSPRLTRKSAKEKLTDLSIQEADIRSEVDSLGDPSVPQFPEDIVIMYSGKLATNLIKSKIGAQNQMAGYIRAYGEIYPGIEKQLQEQYKQFEEVFDTAKESLTELVSAHPLAQRLCKIKGMTPYQLGIIMAFMKSADRFETPGRLMVYAGVGVKYGFKVCKLHLKDIRKVHQEQFTGNPDEYKEFGYNTMFQQRMYIIAEYMVKMKGGYFNEMSKRLRERLEQRAINGGETFIPTKEQIKESKGKMKVGQHYMVGRKNQSLKAWSRSNAMFRVARTLLHLIYTEWRTLRGLPTRVPYPIEYLAHQHLITLEEVLNFELSQKKVS